jgi:hypothetical protein
MSDNEYDPMDPDNERYGGYDQQQQNHNQYNRSMVPEETKYAGFEQQQQLYVHPTNPVNNVYGEYSQQQQQQQHFMQTAPMLFQQQTTMPPQPSSAPLAPWLLNSPQIMQQQQQSQQSLPPPPTSIPLPPLPSAPLPSAPSMHLPSQPPLPSNIQPPPPYYPPDFQSAPPPPPPSIVPAPPQSTIPPPPPAPDDADATDGCDDKDEAYEIAYSPSQAEDEKNVEEVEKDKKVQLAILSSQQKQLDMVNLIRKKEKENEEHTKRMEMENKKIEDLKKRKMISGFAPIKLQKKKLKGFEEPEEDFSEAISKENSSSGDNKKQITGKKGAIENSTDTDNRVISDEKLKLMTQIASYLTNNPNHAAAFIRSKKNEENYEFLHDSERLTNEGRKFREISEKLQAAKNVQNVCGAAVIVSAVNNNDHVTNLNNTIALQMRAAERKDVPAVDYSLLNPFKIDRPPVPAPPPQPTVSQHSHRVQPLLQNDVSKGILLNDTNNAHNLNSSHNDIKSSNTNSAINNNINITDSDSSHSNNNNNSNSNSNSSSSSSSSSSNNSSSSSSSGSHSNQVGLHPSSDVITSTDPPKSNRRNRWGPTVVPNSVVSSSSIAGTTFFLFVFMI